MRLSAAAIAGLIVCFVIGPTTQWRYAPAAGWIAAAAVFLIWTWLVIGHMGPVQTKEHARREDPIRPVADLILLLASVASLGGVAYLLVAGSSHGGSARIAAAVGVGSVAAAWVLIHTVFTLRYARLYYGGEPGGIDFVQADGPAYLDFAYVAFTVGMTYQLADTGVQTRELRSTVLRQALLSYLFGAVILAATINLVVGLGG